MWSSLLFCVFVVGCWLLFCIGFYVSVFVLLCGVRCLLLLVFLVVVLCVVKIVVACCCSLLLFMVACFCWLFAVVYGWLFGV